MEDYTQTYKTCVFPVRKAGFEPTNLAPKASMIPFHHFL